MNLNDRLSLEIGRVVLRAITAEIQRDEALTQLSAIKSETCDESDKTS
jgi:hypothetical protein